MTVHRKNQPCAGCHKIMDPIGFALDNFDADGKWRIKQGGDGGTPIDASVELYDGQQVWPVRVEAGASAVFASVCPHVDRKDDDLRPGPWGGIRRYAALRSIVRDAAKDNNRFSAIVLGIVKSAQFQMRMKVENDAGASVARALSAGPDALKLPTAKEQQCSSRRSTFRAGRFCAAPA